MFFLNKLAIFFRQEVYSTGAFEHIRQEAEVDSFYFIF
jgi:hypothetical protein